MSQSQDHESECLLWFLDARRSGTLSLTSTDGSYLHQLWAEREVETEFWINQVSDLSTLEYIVIFLYRILLRDFNNIPNIGDAEWIRFLAFATAQADLKNNSLRSITFSLQNAHRSVRLPELGRQMIYTNLWRVKKSTRHLSLLMESILVNHHQKRSESTASCQKFHTL